MYTVSANDLKADPIKALTIWSLWKEKNQGYPFVMLAPLGTKEKAILNIIKSISEFLNIPLESFVRLFK